MKTNISILFTSLIIYWQIIEKLSVHAPSGDVRLKVLKEIAREFNVDWDSSNTEAEFSKSHEDLLVFSNLFQFFFVLPCGLILLHMFLS